MQKSGIFNFQKLCQKTVGFLLMAITSVFITFSMAHGLSAPNSYVFGSDVTVPNENTCMAFHDLIQVLREQYQNLESPPNSDSEFYQWLQEEIIYFLTHYNVMANNEKNYVFAVSERPMFMMVMHALLTNSIPPQNILSLIPQAFCSCAGDQFYYTFPTDYPFQYVPICELCTGVVVDQWHCNSCINGFIDSDNKCQACPPGPDGTTVRLTPNATSVQDCYIDNKDEIKLPRGIYICGDPSGECHHPATTDASK